jgi:type 1 fimbriae regulatory protein FimB/type 1 fimbriae regulatory protein FimE
VAPSKKRTVTPTRRPNAELRTREHLTETEIEKLLKAAGTNRWGHWDGTMILVAYRHGLRASELVDLRWDQNFATATLHVRRVKQGTPATHPILGDELRALRRLQREQEPKSAFVFTSERSSPFSTAGLCSHGGARCSSPAIRALAPKQRTSGSRCEPAPATGNEKPGTTGRVDRKKTA